ncbi:serine hydrolase [Novosphingobium sp.]|uniref:serine hydrolase domain-containing protein n=1 Tax=Novosphingobium sp. TaxID=1874826 RepID=UPI0025D40D6E|nr:serine hydrolase domain-containing protein [Novosphingobium sp.]
MKIIVMLASLALSLPAAAQTSNPAIQDSAATLHAIFEANRAALHIPGTVYGVVQDGKLVLVEGLGTRDPQTGAAVDADTRFRIASMSKAFTALAILHLRDQGKISLDAPASRYVPEMRKWKLPTGDSRAITVRDLLHHTAGFVEDNPWGDRQQVLTEREFSALIAGGMDFATAPGTRMEYSNYGFALLGRIITNVSRRPYQQYIRQTIMLPLGMTSTGYDVFASPAESRAIGYRWQDNAWVREPDMRDGTFGAMGGVETTANDYAKWIAFLLSAWPPRDGPELGPVRRSAVRDMVNLASPRGAVIRAAELGPPCRQAVSYGTGLNVIDDCDLGRVVTHSGGYPGYGSNMLLLPDAGVGFFVFNNRTYGGSGLAQMKVALALRKAGAVPDRDVPVSSGLAEAYAKAKAVWQSGDPAAAPLANNVAMDSDLARRAKEIAALKAKAGTCPMTEAIKPVSAAEGTFAWTCSGGIVEGRVQRAPVGTLQLQVIDFRAGVSAR